MAGTVKKIIKRRQGPVVTDDPNVAKAANLLGIVVKQPDTQKRKSERGGPKKTS